MCTTKIFLQLAQLVLVLALSVTPLTAMLDECVTQKPIIKASTRTKIELSHKTVQLLRLRISEVEPGSFCSQMYDAIMHHACLLNTYYKKLDEDCPQILVNQYIQTFFAVYINFFKACGRVVACTFCQESQCVINYCQIARKAYVDVKKMLT